MGGNQSYTPSQPPVVVQKIEKKSSIIRLRRPSESSTNESIASSGRTLRPILQPIPPEDVEYSYVLTRERDRASAKQKQVRLGEYSQPVDAQRDQGDAYCEPYQARKLVEKIQADQDRKRSPKARGPPSIPPPPPPNSSPLDNVYDVARSLPPEPLYDSPPTAENDEDSKHHVPEIRRPSGFSPQSLELEPASTPPLGSTTKSVIETLSLKSRSSVESPKHRLVKAVSVDSHPDMAKSGPSPSSPPLTGPTEPAIYNDPWDSRQQQEQLQQKLMRHQGGLMSGMMGGGSVDRAAQVRSQPPAYEDAWDSPERQRQLQMMFTRQMSSPVASTPSDDSPSSGTGAHRSVPRSQSSSSSNTYEEAWDSAERQRQLEEKVMAAHHRSAAGVVGRGPSPGLGRGPSPGAGNWTSSPTGSSGPGARGPSPGAGSIGGLVRGASPSGSSVGRGSPPAIGVAGHLKGPSPNGSWGSVGTPAPGPGQQSAAQTDLYSEPWDSAEKQREMAARLQASHFSSGWPAGSVIGQTSSPQLSIGSNRSRGSEKEDWDMQGSRTRIGADLRQACSFGNSQPASSTGSLRSQLSCTIGQPIDPMLPLEHQNWYHGNISRANAETMLRVSKEGSFLVRESETERGQYSLSIKNPRQNIHLRIAPRMDGTFILGENSRAFPTIPEMVDYYTRHPVPLKGAEHITLLHPVECKWSSQ